MKGPVVPIIIIALILGGAYYYLFVMKKPAPETEDKPEDKKEPVRLIGNMFEPDHSSEAIASMFSGEDWRKKNPILI